MSPDTPDRQAPDAERTLQILSVPFLLITATWGYFDIILKAIELVNERGDRILAMKAAKDPNYWLVLWCDWLPLALGLFVGFIFFMLVLWHVPKRLAGVRDNTIKQFCVFLFWVSVAFASLIVIFGAWEFKKYMEPIPAVGKSIVDETGIELRAVSD
jgi:hypothetical protein